MEIFRTTSNRRAARGSGGFTLAEIAISLAIIGIGLVAIIGVLPLGLKKQRANREQTVINQDATVLLEAIRSGARGADDLTNYVFMITNTYARPGVAYSNFTSGAEIVGLLSTPRFVDADGNAIPYPSYASPSYSNRMVAFVYSINGPAVEKPPQAGGSLVRQSSFSYGVVCENLPVPAPADTNSTYAQQLAANLRELRLTFIWPLLPDSQPPRVHYGPGYQTFRTSVAGQLELTVDTNSVSGQKLYLYFYQPQTFVNTP
jgi:prepilin-type N-terminal cleavage/methylation domain-containing protein